jgi:hypothetical protein
MGFLRTTKFKGFDDVSLAIQKLDERVSKVEGADGAFKTAKGIDATNTKITNLKAPTYYNDSARYSDAMRTKTYSYSIGGGATLIRSAQYIMGEGYSTGAPTWDLINYKAPCEMTFKRLYINAGQLSATVAADYWISAEIYAEGTGGTLIASTILYTKSGAAGFIVAAETLAFNRRNISKDFDMMLQITTSSKGRWIYANLIADFLVVDK